ncbi:MAG: hypothetical protein K6A67_05055 [Bacteroidales bacterium]|nr:hypothetical protein [Bacteroidales bacterium]
MKMTVIAQLENNIITNLFTWEYFEKHVLGGGTWMLRLSSAQDISKPEEHIYASGQASDIIDEMKRNGTWGTWIITETTERQEPFFNSFGFQNKTYIVTVKEVATVG